MIDQPFAPPFDVILVLAVLFLAFNGPPIMGGFGWLFLLLLSPRAWAK